MKVNEFDFRIWNKKAKKFENTEEYFNLIAKKSNDYEIDLWSGAYDKNGNKIYENDIINFKYDDFFHKNKIVNFSLEFGFKFNIGIGDTYFGNTYVKDIEVIGNIRKIAI